ncbi:DUF1206 domain-containing protein [Leifsonia shinshuensis]|uniref:DUF1206 domain-containing protein n=1 Tax=Leifsonia shinshuensis TaxID=150026 RepID=UPI001F50B36C|nr:DUF1206 domain-containing protein [Leifsonia shinshuensis]MCI0158560.1 DUF1206 domain-containing protein [Leifsonia shinshuensis]
MSAPSRTASRLERSTTVRILTRVGLASIGLLHLLIGIIALAVAAGAGGQADQSGALQAVASAPGGVFVLWLVVAGLIVLAVWQLLVAVTAHGAGTKALEVVKAVVYAALAVVTVSIATGGHHNTTSTEKTLSARLLALPGGVFVLGLVGLVVVVVGAGFIRNGVTHRFERDLKLPPDRWAGTITVLGRVGYIAKGIALLLVGGLVVAAAITVDPSKAGGLDGSLKALVSVPFGVFLLIAIAAGLIAYGLFWCVRAVRARL